MVDDAEDKVRRFWIDILLILIMALLFFGVRLVFLYAYMTPQELLANMDDVIKSMIH